MKANEKILHTDCLIIGAGISGISMAYHAKMQNIDYKLVDQELDYGGVWYQNNYPKLSTDSIEPLYNYKADIPALGTIDTSAKSPAQVREYLGNFINKFDLDNGFYYSTKVFSSTFDGSRYVTETTNGTFYSKYLVIAVGANGLGGKKTSTVPQFKGLDQFKGQILHSSDLSSDYDVSGKNVCVVGNGPTSIQLVESFATQANHLVQLCRTPRQIMRKPSSDKISDLLKRFRINKNDNNAVFNFLDDFFHKYVFTGFSEKNRALKIAYGDMLSGNDNDMYHELFPLSDSEKKFVIYMKELGLVPSWESGYTNLRQLFIDTYDKDVLRENVKLIKTEGIDYLTADGIVTKEGYNVDCQEIICATGSTKIIDFPHFELYDQHNNILNGNADKISENYWGIMNKNYPNMFYLLGPGSAGVQNVPPLVEAQAKLISKIIACDSPNSRVKSITVQEHRFKSYHDKQFNAMNSVKNIQKSLDNFGNMNNHQYHNGINLHEFMGGTLEYRDILDEFTESENTIEMMGLKRNVESIKTPPTVAPLPK